MSYFDLVTLKQKMDSPRIFRNKQGFIHRLGGPAIEIGGQNGRKEWWFNGKRHRTDGPAVYNDEYDNTGRKEWWLNGDRHRADGPAIEYNDEYDNTGRKEWWYNGQRHNADGPAIEYNNGVQYWFCEGLLHRLDGPAYHHSNKNCNYWIYGNKYTEERFYKITGICKKFGNRLKARLRKNYEKELLKTNVCDEVTLYKIIVGYMI